MPTRCTNFLIFIQNSFIWNWLYKNLGTKIKQMMIICTRYYGYALDSMKHWHCKMFVDSTEDKKHWYFASLTNKETSLIKRFGG